MKKNGHITAFYLETLLLIVVFIGINLILTQVFGLGRVQSVEAKRLTLDLYRQRMDRAADRKTGRYREAMGRLAAGLDALSPFRVMGRGYAIPYTEEGSVLTSIRQVQTGDPLELRVSDGRVLCRTEGKEKKQWRKKN